MCRRTNPPAASIDAAVRRAPRPNQRAVLPSARALDEQNMRRIGHCRRLAGRDRSARLERLPAGAGEKGYERAVLQLAGIDATNWRKALAVEVRTDQVPFVATYSR